MEGHIQLMKAIYSYVVVLLLVVAAVVALLRRRKVEGAGWLAAGLGAMALSWLFEALTYTLPPSSTFLGSMLMIGGFMGPAGAGAAAALLGAWLLAPRKKAGRSKK